MSLKGTLLLWLKDNSKWGKCLIQVALINCVVLWLCHFTCFVLNLTCLCVYSCVVLSYPMILCCYKKTGKYILYACLFHHICTYLIEWRSKELILQGSKYADKCTYQRSRSQYSSSSLCFSVLYCRRPKHWQLIWCRTYEEMGIFN